MSLSTRDAVVIGAGPAGSVCATLLAREGLDVLLVDRSRFPRDKVCGGCLNGAAVRDLREHGVLDAHERWPAQRTARFELVCAGGSASIAIPAGVSVSRRALDATLADRARACGAEFRDGISARVGGCEAGRRIVHLAGAGEVRARVVVCAGGLASVARLVEGAERDEVASRARIGLGACIEADDRMLDVGTIRMTAVDGGYLGAVRIEDGRINLAAAVDPGIVRRFGSPGAWARDAYQRATGEEVGALERAEWKGVGRLSRRRGAIAGERLVCIGDACGYTEPFTGEGMAWAIRSAISAAPLVGEVCRTGDTGVLDRWSAVHRRSVVARQRGSRMVSMAIRMSLLRRIAPSAMQAWPEAFERIGARLCAPGAAT